jgi:hypothetical protein
VLNIKKPAAQKRKRGAFAGFCTSFVFILVLFVFPSCATVSPVEKQTALSVPSPEEVRPQWSPFVRDERGGLIDGLRYFAGEISSPRMEFYALRVDLASPKLRIVTAGGGIAASGGNTNGGNAIGNADGYGNANGNADAVSVKVSAFVRGNNLLAGINALPFDPVSSREGESRANLGVVISDGVMISPPYSSFDALVFYKDGGAAIVSQSAISSAKNIHNAVGGFRRILEANEPVSRVLDLKTRHPRSAAGISADGRFLYLLVIDGRRPGSIGATEAETALVLRALGASEGLNLDGGGSSALALRYPNGNVRVVNTPVHDGIPGRERAVAGCIGVAITAQR